MEKGRRSRAAGEIQAMSAALEGYKIDNGIYPATNMATTYNVYGTLLTNAYASTDGRTSPYIDNAAALYLCLSGQTNFNDTPAPGNKAYMSFTIGQVGNPTSGTYVRDPWTYAYGYSIGTGTATAATPYNGNGFYDLWSTGGKLSSAPNPNAWISNWQ